MKPRVNNPAWVRAIQDVIDALPSEPPNQINADPNDDRLLSSSSAAPARCSPGGATSARTPRPTTPRSSATSAASRSCPARTTSTMPRPASGTSSRAARTTRRTGLSRLGRLRHGPRRQRREEAEGGVERGGASRRQGPVALDARPIRPASSPTGTATSTFRNGSRPATTRPSSPPISKSEADSYNHPNAAIEPRIPGIFQYYSIAEDELAKIFAGQIDGAGRRRQHRRGLGEAHRPDRPRQPDQALQGLARHVVAGPEL